MKAIPKVSVIMPVFNAEKYIERSIRSLMLQTFDEVEYIIVDDCSTDDSINIVRKVIAEYPNKLTDVQVLTHSYNQGSAAARSTGLNAAIGDYTIQMDSDDYCEPTMLEELYSIAKKDDADIVICDYYIDYSKKQIKKSLNIPQDGKECMTLLLTGGLQGFLWNKLIKRNLYTDNKLSFVSGLNMWEDLTITIQLCFYAKKVAYLPQAFYHYNQSNVGALSKKLSIQSLKNIEQSVIITDAFLQKYLNKEYSNIILYYKLVAKIYLIINSEGAIQKKYSKYYQETTAVIWQHPQLSLYYKFALWFASNRMLFILNIMFGGLNVIKNIVRGD